MSIANTTLMEAAERQNVYIEMRTRSG